MELRGKHLEAIALLLAGKNATEVAAALKVSTRTLTTWTSDPDFAAAYKTARTKVFNEALDRLQVLAVDAVKTLEECLAAEKASDQIKAALGILGQAVQTVEVQKVAEELAQFKATLEAQRNGGHVSGPGAGMAARQNGVTGGSAAAH
jgi:metal-sulfur cluster biosynthetic enzyme